MRRLVTNREFLLLAIIMLVAIFFRIFRLNEVPRGMTGDEAVRGLEASSIARGERYPVFFEENDGEEPMHAYLVAVLFRFLGTSVLSIRAASALVGIVTVPLLYLLVKELFPPQEGRQWSTVGMIAAGWLATSYWHTVYSRYGLEPILVPLFAVLILYFLWRGFHLGRRLSFGCTGVFLGLSLYTYQAARFLPLVVFVLLVCCSWMRRGFLRSQWTNIVALLLACAITAAPLGVYAVSHPDVFFSRARGVSIFNPHLNEGSAVRALGISLAKNVAMYAFLPDLNREHNPAGRPLLDAITTVFLAVGLGITVYGGRQAPYRFLLIWIAIMSLPGLVTTGGPHFSRTIGALPAVYVLAAIGVMVARKWLAAKLRSRALTTTLGSILVAVPLVFAGLTTYTDYFLVWETNADLRQGYDGAYTAAAAIMNETRVPDSVWILPLTALAQSGYGSDHFHFLYQGDTPYYTLRVDEATGAEELSSILRVGHKALVVDWKGYVLEKAYEAISADPKNLISFLMQKYGRELDRRSYEAFDVVTYQVPESPTFSIAEQFAPLAVHFGDELILTGVAFGGSSLQDTSTPEEVERRQLPSGKSGWVVLRWRATREPSRSYKVAVYLEDQGGHIAGQVDKLLLSNYLHTTSDWHSGQEEIDYYTLPSWNGSAPGWYKVGITVYDADSADVLYRRDGARSYELGMMEIVRPLVSGQVEPEASVDDEESEVADSMRLLGYDLPRRELSPGDELSVALYWQAMEDLNRDYLLAVQLANKQGVMWAEEFDAPVYGSYPTVEWAKGETLKDWHEIRLPTDMAQGRYQVSVLVAEEGTLLRDVGLEEILVRGRPRQFIIPQIQNPHEARLGQGVQFLGHDVNSDEIRTGGTLQLTLYWQALAEMDVSYTVFAHLLDPEEQIWGQIDNIPLRGEAPTTSWVSGEVIADEYDITVEPGASPGDYTVEVGMYDATTGRRLPVSIDGQLLEGDRLVLGQIRVLP